MKRFQFSLSTVLRLRERKEEEEIRNLSLIVSKLNALFSEKEGHELAIQRTYQMMDSHSSIGNSIHELFYWDSFIRASSERIKRIEVEIQAREREANHQREILMLARKDKKVIEVLRENRFQEWKKKRNRQERREIEEYNFSLSQSPNLAFESSGSSSQKKKPKTFKILNRDDGGDEFMADFQSLKAYYEKFYQGKGA